MRLKILLFSVNPAFDLLPANEDIDRIFLRSPPTRSAAGGISTRRARSCTGLCERRGVAINVMKGYAGGRLFAEKTVALRRGTDAGAVPPLRPHTAGCGQRDGWLRYRRNTSMTAVAYETAIRGGEGLRQRAGRRAAPCVLAASVPTAATVRRARPASTLPWQTSFMTWL